MALEWGRRSSSCESYLRAWFRQKRDCKVRLFAEKGSNVIDDGPPIANVVRRLQNEERILRANAEFLGGQGGVRSCRGDDQALFTDRAVRQPENGAVAE